MSRNRAHCRIIEFYCTFNPIFATAFCGPVTSNHGVRDLI